MRKWINLLVVVFTIISLYIISYTELNLFWPLGNSLKYDEINRILTQLSYSFLAGAFFYLLVTYLPNRIASQKAYSIWKPELISIYLYLSTIIAALKCIYGINKIDAEITEEDTKVLDTYKPEYSFTFLKQDYYIDGKKGTSPQKMTFSYRDHLTKYCNLIQKKIDKIINLPVVAFIDVELAEIIAALRASRFLESFTSNPWINMDNIEHTHVDFGRYFYEVLKLHQRLSKYKFSKHTYTNSPMTDEDIIEYNKSHQSLAKMLLDNGLKFENGKLEQIK